MKEESSIFKMEAFQTAFARPVLLNVQVVLG